MVGPVLRRAGACLLGITLLSAAPASALAAATPQQRARDGAGYVASHQKANGSIPAFSPIGSTADAIVSFVAAGRGAGNVTDALRYLSQQVGAGNVTGVGLRAKVVMAAVAAGKDPRTFGGSNLVSQILQTQRPNGRYGASTAVYDQALAMLALAASGAGPSKRATSWLASAQCDDGGWQYDAPAVRTDDRHCLDGVDPSTDFFESDTNTTSLAVQALAVGRGNAAPANDPFAFFSSLRDPQFGGWGYTWGLETTDANSTALVIQAYAASGTPLPSGALGALNALQYRSCGAWAYSWTDDGHGGFARTSPDVGATIGAILGALQRPLPVDSRPVTKPAPSEPSCT